MKRTVEKIVPSPAGRRPYAAPAIVYDAPLEAQAGSPLSDPLQGLFDDSQSGLGQ